MRHNKRKHYILLIFALVLVLTGCIPSPMNPNEKPTGADGLDGTGSSQTNTMPKFDTQPGEICPTKPSGDTYGNGTPYTPWGTLQSITFTLEDGTKLSFSGNTPKMRYSKMSGDTVWYGRTEDNVCAFAVSCTDGSAYSGNLESFFDDHITELTTTFNTMFPTYRVLSFKLMDAEQVAVKGQPMSKIKGVVISKLPSGANAKPSNFIAYAIKTSTGDFLYWICVRTGGDWAETQYTAENFAMTFKEN